MILECDDLVALIENKLSVFVENSVSIINTFGNWALYSSVNSQTFLHFHYPGNILSNENCHLKLLKGSLTTYCSSEWLKKPVKCIHPIIESFILSLGKNSTNVFRRIGSWSEWFSWTLCSNRFIQRLATSLKLE